MRYRYGLSLLIVLAACADARPGEPREEPSPVPDVVRIVCEADGSTSLSTPSVEVRPDGLHMVIENRLAEPASINGFGFDADPGESEWVHGTPPGDHRVACWPFSQHPGGEAPVTHALRVLDPEGLYVPAPELECEAWSAHGDFVSPTTGGADDPVEAARVSLSGLEVRDQLAVWRSGYPEAQAEDQATVVVSREGRIIAVVGAFLADDGRWFAPNASGCVDSGLDFG